MGKKSFLVCSFLVFVMSSVYANDCTTIDLDTVLPAGETWGNSPASYEYKTTKRYDSLNRIAESSVIGVGMNSTDLYTYYPTYTMISIIDNIEGPIGTRQLYTNGHNHIDSVLEKVLINNDWVNRYRATIKYNSKNDLPVKYSWYQWTDDEWIPMADSEFVYDERNNRTFSQYSAWDYSLNMLVINYQVINKYDSVGQTIESIYKHYSVGSLQEQIRRTYTYNNQGKVVEEYEYNWDESSSSWKFLNKTLTTFNNQGQIIAIYNYNWDESSSSWRFLGKTIITFTVESGIKITTNDEFNSDGLLYSRRTDTIGSNGKVRVSLYHDFDNMSSDHKLEYTYDCLGNILTSGSLVYIEGSWEYLTFSTSSYFYVTNPPTKVSHAVLSKNVPQISYKNGCLFVEGLKSISKISAEMFDLRGRKVDLRIAQGTKNSINISFKNQSLSKTPYLIRLKDDNRNLLWKGMLVIPKD